MPSCKYWAGFCGRASRCLSETGKRCPVACSGFVQFIIAFTLWQWWLWMERKDASILSSWESWWLDEHSYVTTNSYAKKISILVPMPRYCLMFVGILASLSGRPLHEGVMQG